jgi:hypothetical protein
MEPPQVLALLLAIFLIVSIMIGMNDDMSSGEAITGVIVITMGVIIMLSGALAVYGLGYIVVGKLLGW